MVNVHTQKYRIISLIRPTLSSDKALQMLQGMIGNLSDTEQIESQTMNMQILAYPIDRNKQGHLVVTELRIAHDSLNRIRRAMEIDENILRVMFIKHDAKDREFNVRDEFIKSMTIHTTKRGKIVFNKTLSRKDKVHVSQSIKRLRFLALMPYCNYDI